MKVGFIGLGRMGRGMAERLLDAGHALSVWNRTRAAAVSLGSRGASIAGKPDELAGCEVVITMLADDAAVDAVWVESGLPARMSQSTIHLNMASVSLGMAHRLTALHQAAGTPYVAAPVFGRPEAAASGQLDIVAAGPHEALERCAALFGILGRQWFDVGSQPPHAAIVKIARNFLLGAIIESLGEAFALVGKAGVEPETFFRIITGTSMNCPAYRSYGKLILEPPAHPTFTLKLGLKDVNLALEAAADTDVPMPLAALLREQHLAAIAEGYGEREWATLGDYIAQRAGLRRRGAGGE